jgi:hypothetical protein
MSHSRLREDPGISEKNLSRDVGTLGRTCKKLILIWFSVGRLSELKGSAVKRPIIVGFRTGSISIQSV